MCVNAFFVSQDSPVREEYLRKEVRGAKAFPEKGEREK